MINKYFFVPVMRIIAVLYFIYKMIFAAPSLNWKKLLEFDNSSSGTLVGDIFVRVVFGLIFVAFVIYQFRQASTEFKQNTIQKNRLRLVSIIWSFLFYPVALLSLFNVNLANLALDSHV